VVKSYASKVDGEWLQSPSSSKIRNAAYRFNSESDPLYEQAIKAKYKTEAERRSDQINDEGGSDGEGGESPTKREASKPEPVLKPRSQQGRHRDISEPWLKEQYEAARKHTKPAASPPTSPDNAPRQTRGPTQSI